MRPPVSVLREFGVEGTPLLLPGGQGSSWAVGGLVLKPGGGAVDDWLADVLTGLWAPGLRLAEPVRAANGSWSGDGWTATRWVDGAVPDHTQSSTWLEILEAGRAFHRAVAHLSRPGCLDARDDPWAVADRVAWDEHTLLLHSSLAGLGLRLRRALAPLGPSQVVHGDLTGNVLLSPSLPPAVIDVSPYWRPTEYAEGVVIADALCWHGAHASLLDQTGVSVAAVARALLFRMTTTSIAHARGFFEVDLEDEAERYALATAAIGL